MNVLLVDLDDTLIPDLSARDQALATMLAGFGRAIDPSEAWPIVRQEWRDSGLGSISALTGVSSWEALWTDFDAAVTSSRAQVAGHTYQANVWRHLLPDLDPVLVGAAFRHAREELVRTFDWVPGRVTVWAKAYDLWCVTNGSLWLAASQTGACGAPVSLQRCRDLG